ncbi:hypothetical protein [Nostoc sp.]|uniref:hypothetical protein n=1 Tax=Nostoc sp. TaxID=1180 RepID=UPI002FFA535D
MRFNKTNLRDSATGYSASLSLDNKLGDVYDGLRLRIKPCNPQLTIWVLCPNPDDCVLIKVLYEIVRSQ